MITWLLHFIQEVYSSLSICFFGKTQSGCCIHVSHLESLLKPKTYLHRWFEPAHDRRDPIYHNTSVCTYERKSCVRWSEDSRFQNALNVALMLHFSVHHQWKKHFLIFDFARLIHAVLGRDENARFVLLGFFRCQRKYPEYNIDFLFRSLFVSSTLCSYSFCSFVICPHFRVLLLYWKFVPNVFPIICFC